jgi:hypothetical protein
MILVIRTQVFENYAWNEDGTIGTGENAYWKAKGGSDYKVLNVPTNANLAKVVDAANVVTRNDYIQESIIDWSLEADGYLSQFEKDQLEYDGSILFPEPTLEYNTLEIA